MKAAARRRIAFTDKNVIHILHPGYGRDSDEALIAQLRALRHEQCSLVVEQRFLVAELRRLHAAMAERGKKPSRRLR